MHGDFWFRMLGLLAVIGLMVGFPTFVLWRDGKKAEQADAATISAESAGDRR